MPVHKQSRRAAFASGFQRSRWLLPDGATPLPDGPALIEPPADMEARLKAQLEYHTVRLRWAEEALSRLGPGFTWSDERLGSPLKARDDSGNLDMTLARCRLEGIVSCRRGVVRRLQADLDRHVQAARPCAPRQPEHVEVADVCGHFLHLLAEALTSGRAHVANPAGNEPMHPECWGWRPGTIGAGDNARAAWQSQGRRIGWADGENLYLDPVASYWAAQELAREQGESLTVSAQTLRKRLKKRRLLVSTEAGKTTTRRTLEGRVRAVVHLHAGLWVPKPRKSGEQGERGEALESKPESGDFAPGQ
jgi:hypothetical protein